MLLFVLTIAARLTLHYVFLSLLLRHYRKKMSIITKHFSGDAAKVLQLLLGSFMLYAITTYEPPKIRIKGIAVVVKNLFRGTL